MNGRIAAIPPSLIRSISAMKRPGDIDLGLGQPTLPPDIDAFAAALEWTRIHGCPYSPNAGLTELRALIADYLGSDPWKAGAVTADNVCVTVGSEEALYLAIKTIIEPDRDEVLIVEPCYLAYQKICMLEGIQHRTVALSASDGFQPRAEVVLDAVGETTRLIVINSPSNPTGRIWPEPELRRLAEGLAARPGRPVWVLSDEVYRELYFVGDRPRSISEFHAATLVASSLSKSNALTGLRLGWLAGPVEVIAAATKVQQFVNTAAATFSQRVAVALLEAPHQLSVHRPIYAATRERLLAAATAANIELIEPEGTFYALIRLPASLAGASLAAAERILDETRVVTVPGRAFGASAEGWLRISWVVEPAAIEEGVRRIGDWLQLADKHEKSGPGYSGPA